MWVFPMASREKMFKNGEIQFLLPPPKMTGGEAKSEASVVTVAVFHLLKVYLIC